MAGTVTEAQEQAELFKWANLRMGKYPELKLMYHIPNEGKRKASTGANLVKQGLKSGVPDICLPVPKGGYHGLYIELKTARGKLSGKQKQWLSDLNKQDYIACVCYGCQEAIKTIEKYLKLR